MDGLIHLPVQLSAGQQAEIAVPSDWLGSTIEEKLGATAEAVRQTLAGDDQSAEARSSAEAVIRAALASDRDAVVDLIVGFVVRLIHARNTEAKEAVAPEQELALARKLALELVGFDAFWERLARWLATSTSAWVADDREAPLPLVAGRVAYLVTLQAEEAAKTITELVSPETPEAGPPTSEIKLPNGTLMVLSSDHFQGLREALYKNTFRKVKGTPWPTAPLDESGAAGFAQLRPAVMDAQPLIPETRLEAWAETMWKQQRELSDLDADGLDALCAIYLGQAHEADDAAVADVDEILRMRGLKPKRGGQGRRGGFEPEQRAEMLRALSHIQNLWIDIGDVRISAAGAKEGAADKSTIKRLQSRPFIITDRMGQVRLDGYMDVERFIFRPGKAFSLFLFGAGRQTGLLFQKALRYDPIRRKWEKRLTRYVSWHWRAVAHARDFDQRYSVATLMEAIGAELNQRYPAKSKKRLEKALDILREDGVIADWSYADWKGTESARGWGNDWLSATIAIQPPPEIVTYYTSALTASSDAVAETNRDHSLAEKLALQRKTYGISQLQIATRLGIRQGYYSKLERGLAKPSPELLREIEAWLQQ